MTACTCPSGDGSLRWPCPLHPPEQIADEEPKPRALPDYAAMEETAEWANQHYSETHGRELGDD